MSKSHHKIITGARDGLLEGVELGRALRDGQEDGQMMVCEAGDDSMMSLFG